MSGCRIVQAGINQYKNDIVKLWNDNLTGVSGSRFEWMKNNPDGLPVWFMAVQEKSKRVVGSISIMPRKIKINGKEYLSGIIGDFMVDTSSRGFGPALQLLKAVLKAYSELGFTFIYTYPNPKAEKMAIRAGFKNTCLIKKYTKVLKVNYLLKKYFPEKIGNILSYGVNTVLKLFSKETYMMTNIEYKEVVKLPSEFEQCLSEFTSQLPILGIRNSKYIEWKYINNPLIDFKIFTFSKKNNKKISGYIPFYTQNNKITIFDFIVKEEDIKPVLAKFLKYTREAEHDSVTIRISNSNSLNAIFKYFGFYDQREDIPLLFAGDHNLLPDKMMFFDGDRNI